MTETRIEDTAVCYASFHVGSQYQPCLAKCWMVLHWVYHSMITTQLYHHWLVVLNYAPKSEPSQPIIPSIVENNKWIYIYIIISIYIYIIYTCFKPPSKLFYDIIWLYHNLTTWRFPKSSGYPQIIQVIRLVTWGSHLWIEHLGPPQNGPPQNFLCSDDYRLAI